MGGKPAERPRRPLQAPVREINRPHLVERGQRAMSYLAQQLHDAGISGMAKVQVGPDGRPTIVILVRGHGAEEARMILPWTVGGFTVKVV